MRDDFDSVVADRFKVLDQVPVPDTWSRIQRSRPAGPGPTTAKEVLTMIDLETPVPNEPRQKSPMRIVVAAVLAAAAAVVAIALVVTRDGGGDGLEPSDQPSPTVTVSPTPPAGAVRHTRRAVRARHLLRRRRRRNTDAADLHHRRRRVVEHR